MNTVVCVATFSSLPSDQISDACAMRSAHYHFEKLIIMIEGDSNGWHGMDGHERTNEWTNERCSPCPAIPYANRF